MTEVQNFKTFRGKYKRISLGMERPLKRHMREKIDK